MTKLRFLVLPCLILSYTISVTLAQTFSSGSDGSFGEINITENTTLDLPADGIFNATTITVASGATLTFNRNALNTPVYLLATGDILIEGAISVSGATASGFAGGLGGPGGFDGGVQGNATLGFLPGPGFGPGAGQPRQDGESTSGHAAYGEEAPGPNTDANNGTTYGSPLLIPLVGGSGGGGGFLRAGTGGGGAVLLASDTRVHIVSPGGILAEGGGRLFQDEGSGSGGAIRIVSPIVSGNGILSVYGGAAAAGNLLGGNGRIRIDLIDHADFNLSYFPSPSTSNAVSIGSFMTVIPALVPRLDIIAVGGQPIAEGTPGPVETLLPFDAPTSQTVTVRAQDFTGIVPINVVLSPQSGPRTVVPAAIDMSLGNPAEVTVGVELPVNVITHLHVWTRSE